ATTVNRTDCANLRAKPDIMRLTMGLFRPKKHILGTDFAGVVEQSGSGTSRFQPGDRVFGMDDSGLASQAEYLVISDKKAISKIPENTPIEQAVASVEGAHYALNFINKVKLNPGQKVMVNGGTGAIGSAMIQLLVHFGAEVTASCRPEHKEAVRKLGAKRTIDYTQTDFTKDNERFDYVFDSVGKSTFFKCKPLLKKKGVYISSELGPYIQNPFLALLTPLFGGKQVRFPLPVNIQHSLDLMHKLLGSGEFNPLIDCSYLLEEVSAAYAYVESGQKVGNVVLKMRSSAR
ncbi:MAG: NAD(P)-dependent alcohol dehydrogenase, partial [Eudoraea sp.]|nr:NAD(P)-dependent alcohol dehydrogenase [Eudoraea sp.]